MSNLFDGSEYEGKTNKFNKPHGYGVQTYQNGDIYKGNFSNGIK